MSKPAKLSVLLSAAWFIVVCALSATGSFRSYPHELKDFITYLLSGLALINLGVWGYRWFSAQP